MRYEEALAWLRGERSTINYRKTIDPESDVRVAQEDAALTEQAYWIVRAHKEGLLADV